MDSALGVSGLMTLKKYTDGKLVQTEQNHNIYNQNGQSYILGRYLQNDQSITKFYLGLINATAGILNVKWSDSATNRTWKESQFTGIRQEWKGDLSLWPSVVSNATANAVWTMPPGMVGSVFVRGAFLVPDETTVYDPIDSNNSGRTPPYAASLVLAAIELAANDVLYVEYAITLTL